MVKRLIKYVNGRRCLPLLFICGVSTMALVVIWTYSDSQSLLKILEESRVHVREMISYSESQVLLRRSNTNSRNILIQEHIITLQHEQMQTSSASRHSRQSHGQTPSVEDATKAPKELMATTARWRIPRIFHQFARDVHLPAPYMMSLTGLLRHHHIRNPNSPTGATQGARLRREPSEQRTIGVDENEERRRSGGNVSSVINANCTHNHSHCGTNSTAKQQLTGNQHVALTEGNRFDYFFWSDASIKGFVASLQSNANRAVLQKYSHILEQSDAVRYAVLYEFGGVYLDMDVEFVAPIERYLDRGYPCVFPKKILSRRLQIGDARMWLRNQ